MRQIWSHYLFCLLDERSGLADPPPRAYSKIYLSFSYVSPLRLSYFLEEALVNTFCPKSLLSKVERFVLTCSPSEVASKWSVNFLTLIWFWPSWFISVVVGSMSTLDSYECSSLSKPWSIWMLFLAMSAFISTTPSRDGDPLNTIFLLSSFMSNSFGSSLTSVLI